MKIKKNIVRSLLFFVSSLGVLLAITVFPFSPAIQAAWIIGLTIVLWASNVLPQWFTALLFFVLCAIADIVPPEVFLSGMISPAIWLLAGGSIIGLATTHTGLGNRIAARIVPLMSTYPRALWGSALLGLILVFLIPAATGRILVLLPILLPLTEQLGYKDIPHARHGILLAAILSTFLPGFTVLPSNVPNNVLLGILKSLSIDTPTYSQYLLLHFPIFGMVKVVLIVGLLMLLYRAPAPSPVQVEFSFRLTLQEKILLVILSATLLLWMSEFLHGISTAWVAMIGALFCLYPRWKLTPQKPLQAVSTELLFYIAAIVSLGTVAYHSGLAECIANTGLGLLPFDQSNNPGNFALLASLSTVVSMVVTLPGTPAILTPMTRGFADLTGWSSMAVYMAQVVGFSTVFFPYQAPPLVLAMQQGGIPLREMIRILLSISLLTIVILWPLDYWWWMLLQQF